LPGFTIDVHTAGQRLILVFLSFTAIAGYKVRYIAQGYEQIDCPGIDSTTRKSPAL